MNHDHVKEAAELIDASIRRSVKSRIPDVIIICEDDMTAASMAIAIGVLSYVADLITKEERLEAQLFQMLVDAIASFKRDRKNRQSTGIDT